MSKSGSHSKQISPCQRQSQSHSMPVCPSQNHSFYASQLESVSGSPCQSVRVWVTQPARVSQSKAVSHSQSQLLHVILSELVTPCQFDRVRVSPYLSVCHSLMHSEVKLSHVSQSQSLCVSQSMAVCHIQCPLLHFILSESESVTPYRSDRVRVNHSMSVSWSQSVHDSLSEPELVTPCQSVRVSQSMSICLSQNQSIHISYSQSLYVNQPESVSP